ncbi:hypothetical protein KAR34_07175 [bacterium]|nr:hypothetical protein [bacterium]
MKNILRYSIVAALVVSVGAMVGCALEIDKTRTPAEKKINEAKKSIVNNHEVLDENESKTIERNLGTGKQVSERMEAAIEEVKNDEEIFDKMRKLDENERKEAERQYPLDGKNK